MSLIKKKKPLLREKKVLKGGKEFFLSLNVFQEEIHFFG